MPCTASGGAPAAPPVDGRCVPRSGAAGFALGQPRHRFCGRPIRIPLIPVCQSALRPEQVTSGPWRGLGTQRWQPPNLGKMRNWSEVSAYFRRVPERQHCAHLADGDVAGTLRVASAHGVRHSRTGSSSGKKAKTLRQPACRGGIHAISLSDGHGQHAVRGGLPLTTSWQPWRTRWRRSCRPW